MADKQTSLKEEVRFTGIGLHTGEKVNLTVKPASADTWYKFVRTDLDGSPEIPANADYVISTERGTTLEYKGTKVYTTEHILAALYGFGIDNAVIELDGPEVPIMDGSAQLFVEAFEKAGIIELEEDREYFEFEENLPWEDLNKGIEMLAVPADDFRLTVMVDYNSPVLGTQHATMYHLGEFKKEIACCRTFVFLRELEYLAKNNLIKGGDLDNAVVLVEREDISPEELKSLAKLLGKEELKVEVKGIGVLNSSKLKFQNEPARHKLLDIVGDLALVGKMIKGHILAARPGHSGNVTFATIIKQIIKDRKKAGKKFDLEKEPLYDINDIAKLLPHRYPFLLVDKVMEITENSIVGLKNITFNEPQFTGHFPDNPVFPGVFQIEAMAQLGGVFALSTVDEPEFYSTYFMKIDGVKFKKKILPGDTMVMELELLTPIRRGIVHMAGKCYVNGQVASEAEMMAQIIKDRA